MTRLLNGQAVYFAFASMRVISDEGSNWIRVLAALAPPNPPPTITIRALDWLNALKGKVKSLTKETPRMWGKAMVGFGTFHYRGKTSEGDWFHVGFSPRKQNLTLYLHCELEKQGDLLDKLGKHKIGKSCLYLKSLDGIDLGVLAQLIKAGLKDLKKKYETDY